MAYRLSQRANMFRQTVTKHSTTVILAPHLVPVFLQGTFAADYNNQPFCTNCPPGMTTPDEGSTDSTACSHAQRGMFVSEDGEGVACPLDTYSDLELANTECTPCPFGLKTENVGSEGVAMCLAPPGWELR